MPLTYYCKIGSTELGKISKYEVERNKLWTNSSRNLAGNLRATLIGIFPKINLEFSNLTQNEMKDLIALIEPATLSVSWWDEKTQGYKTGNFYAGDFKFSILNKSIGMYDKVTLSLVAYSKYT